LIRLNPVDARYCPSGEKFTDNTKSL